MIREGFGQGGGDAAGGRHDRLAYATLDALSEHVAVLDGRGTVVAVNRAWRDFAAANAPTTRGLLEGANYFDACERAEGEDAEYGARFAEGLRAVIAGGPVEFTLEYPCHAPAQPRWFVARVTRFELDGEVRAVVIHTDITKRKLAEQSLARSESEYRLLLEHASDGIHTYDPRGRILDTNSKFCEMVGYAREELLRLNVEDLVTPEDLAASPVRFDELQSGRTLLTERVLLRKDGARLPVEISGRMIREGVLQSIVRDISERKRVEEALRETHAGLERRVEERTAELARSNETLRAEVAERERAEAARRDLLGRLVTAQEEERRRISRELHDRMGQQLAALMMGLKTLGSESYGRRSALDTLRQLEEMSDELSREVHTLAWGLRPPALDDMGLETALYNYAEEWAERSRVPVDFHSAGFGGGRLPLTHETALYRIAQEALTNVARHSGADRVSFILERRGDHVFAVIEDNGGGFDVEAATGPPGRGRRLGLLGMRERAALLGGNVNVESAPGAGTTLFVRIPFDAGGVEGAE
ncbi:MAG TPA: PAS domain S-box protein [Pyrinomonadaceae bacterium]|nr:PAS domain S-box protein [Pyrinomonadaceae bacterium]